MIPRRIENASIKMRPPENWDVERNGVCIDLWVRVREAHGNPCYESAYEPTPAELAILNAGGSVILRVLGGQPPVALYVENNNEQG